MNAEILTSNRPVNLCGKALKYDCKLALVNLTHDGNNSYGTIEDKYNLKYQTLRKYFKKVRKGLPMFETSGRPPKLDEQSVDVLRYLLSTGQVTDKAHLHKNIRAQNIETTEVSLIRFLVTLTSTASSLCFLYSFSFSRTFG